MSAKRTASLLAGSAALALLVGCGTMGESADFDRHRYSQLVVPLERSDRLYFDVTISERFPADDEDAEAQRMRWLEAWLARRSACPDGYEIVERRPFEFLEHNPARHDLRYEVRCQKPDG